MQGLSIGFKPIEHELIPETKGLRFTEWSWLETSCRHHSGKARSHDHHNSTRSTLRSGPRLAKQSRAVSFISPHPAPRDKFNGRWPRRALI